MVHNHTRSVAELRRESERTRAELTQTVETLRYKISDTASDIREKVSPQNIKAEVTGYVSQRGRDLAESLKQQALANPMQTLAATSAIAVPALRLMRTVPLPVLMIGAGLALASPRVRNAIADQLPELKRADGSNLLDDAAELARDGFDAARARAGSAIDDARDAAAQLSEDFKERTADLADAASRRLAAAKDDVKQAAAAQVNSASDALSSKVHAASEAVQASVKDKVDRTRTKATDAMRSAEGVVRDHSALIAGAGIAIGALIALSLPAFRKSNGAHAAAADTGRLSASAQFRAGEAGADYLTTVADETVTTAFEPMQSNQR